MTALRLVATLVIYIIRMILDIFRMFSIGTISSKNALELFDQIPVEVLCDGYDESYNMHTFRLSSPVISITYEALLNTEDKFVAERLIFESTGKRGILYIIIKNPLDRYEASFGIWNVCIATQLSLTDVWVTDVEAMNVLLLVRKVRNVTNFEPSEIFVG